MLRTHPKYNHKNKRQHVHYMGKCLKTLCKPTTSAQATKMRMYKMRRNLVSVVVDEENVKVSTKIFQLSSKVALRLL